MIERLNGDFVSLKVNDSRHYGFKPKEKVNDDFVSQFGQALTGALKGVNGMQVNSDKMSVQMMLRPESVNVHDVMIAQQKAQMSLDLTKSVLQKTMQAYQNITNIR